MYVHKVYTGTGIKGLSDLVYFAGSLVLLYFSNKTFNLSLSKLLAYFSESRLRQAFMAYIGRPQQGNTFRKPIEERKKFLSDCLEFDY
jgi:hypothetical protein